MTIKEYFKPKHYNFFVKLIAIGIFVYMLFIILGLTIYVIDSEKFYYADNYYEWSITGDTVEALSDGTYKVTLDLKNNSAYEATIYEYNIRYEYGSSGTLSNIEVPYSDISFLDTLNNVVLPAGQTIKYSVTLNPPKEINSITAVYQGKSYRLAKAYEKDDDNSYYSYYTIDLK